MIISFIIHDQPPLAPLPRQAIMPDRSLTYSRAGDPPIPSQPAWFERLDEILGALRAMTSAQLDRAAVEKLFRVRRRLSHIPRRVIDARPRGAPPRAILKPEHIYRTGFL